MKYDARCLPMGRFVITDLVTGEQEQTNRLSVRCRREALERFVRRHRKLCRTASKFGTGPFDWRSRPGRKLIDHARAEMHYRPSTNSLDIYWRIMKMYTDLFT